MNSVNKTKEASVFGTNLAIIIYYFLPRMQITTHSSQWNLFFNFRDIGVTFITIAMLTLTYQKFHTNKRQNINVDQMVVSAYILYLLATIFYFMMIEFI